MCSASSWVRPGSSRRRQHLSADVRAIAGIEPEELPQLRVAAVLDVRVDEHCGKVRAAAVVEVHRQKGDLGATKTGREFYAVEQLEPAALNAEALQVEV